MAKRFTEANKWADPWFRKLPIEYKTLWQYLCDKCDNAGVWKKDIELAEFYIGAQLTEKAALEYFNNGKERIKLLDSGLWLLTDFVSFQYGELSMGCPPHKQILSLIEKYKSKGLDYPYVRVQEKEKDKDKEKDKEKDKKKKNPEVKIFIDYAADTFKTLTGESLCVDGGKDGAIVKRLLGTYGLDRLKGLWDTFLASTDPFIEQAGRSIGVFKSQINKLLSSKLPSKMTQTLTALEQARVIVEGNDKKVLGGGGCG
jgi:hypothetical protein